MSKKSKIPESQTCICRFCQKPFSSEKTLSRHMCTKKQRFNDKDTIGARLGFRVFQRFFEVTTSSKKPKTTEDFINSRHYQGFVKFGRHLASVNPIYLNDFVDFLIKNSVDLSKWTNEGVYEVFLAEIVKKEPAEKALERTIVFLMSWATENNTEYNKFFTEVSPYEAVHLIKTGRLSPWVLFLAPSADEMFKKFNEEHYGMIKGVVDTAYWMTKFKKNENDTTFILNTLTEAGL